jgi:aconitate hydratase
MSPGEEIAILIDQTLTQDSTGTMAYLQFESMGVPRVKTKRSVSYIDHNTLQTSSESANDHIYLKSVAAKYGVYFSKPGNGICHQVHLERFAVPGFTLLGSDSHTPNAGGIGMLAIGAGGLDVAVAMGGGAYYLSMPKVCKVNLKGKLSPWVTAKDVILEMLRRLSVKGGVGKIFEYSGEGVASLSVPERATITNMGTELGATTSIFPSDEVTKAFLEAQGRLREWMSLEADKDAVYDEELTIDLSLLEPMVAKPHSPDNIDTVKGVGSIKVNQVAIGSCTNSSYVDLMRVAHILKGKTVHPDVSAVISPGSKQVFTMLSENGALTDLIDSGVRILESACGPCIGMGQAPSENAVSLRTFNRNFYARSGTASANVYLCSPEVAAVSALTGVLTDPRDFGAYPEVQIPDTFIINDNLIIPPPELAEDVEVEYGPNIKPFPVNEKIQNSVKGSVLLKMTDNITTDHIMPSNARLLPHRSNIPYLSDFCLTPVDSEFPARAKALHGGFLVAGVNYGQGSSREHAALVPLYLKIKGILAQSFARIHMANLINSGILPLVFANPDDYDTIDQGDELTIENAAAQIEAGDIVMVRNVSKSRDIATILKVSPRIKAIISAGGLLNYTKNKSV